MPHPETAPSAERPVNSAESSAVRSRASILPWAMSAVIVACVILIGYLWWSTPTLTSMNQADDHEITCPALGAPLGTGGSVDDYRIGSAELDDAVDHYVATIGSTPGSEETVLIEQNARAAISEGCAGVLQDRQTGIMVTLGAALGAGLVLTRRPQVRA
ncbi:hypothetical protein [Citricoccus sp. NR2]|uniref:hypothetical protein n=1 Tax=Citricoccus sp. NR2 TaxID=3004095 RepID=UPI0022DD8929|nr:hypothetical protein [Citricoccus sp. NR2]WBL19694.1 hypothetical protein O1A05_03080 [Citricoccus sp. NR2]